MSRATRPWENVEPEKPQDAKLGTTDADKDFEILKALEREEPEDHDRSMASFFKLRKQEKPESNFIRNAKRARAQRLERPEPEPRVSDIEKLALESEKRNEIPEEKEEAAGEKTPGHSLSNFLGFGLLAFQLFILSR